MIAVAEAGREGEQRLYGTISSDLHALEKALRNLGGQQRVWPLDCWFLSGVERE